MEVIGKEQIYSTFNEMFNQELWKKSRNVVKAFLENWYFVVVVISMMMQYGILLFYIINYLNL